MVMEPEANSAEVTVDDTVEEPAVDLHSDEKPLQDSEEQNGLLTKEQADKIFNERQSKLDKRIFDLTKASEKSQKALEAAIKRAEDAEKAVRDARKSVEEMERKSYGDTPEALNLFEERVKLRQAQDELDEAKRKWQAEKTGYEDELNEAREYRKLRLADEIAAKYEVDATLLVQLTDGTQEKMETLAKSLPKKSADDKPVIPKPPDSQKKSRVLTNPTVEQIDNFTMEEHVEWANRRDKNRY